MWETPPPLVKHWTKVYSVGMESPKQMTNEPERLVTRKIRGLMGEHRCSQKELGEHLDLSQGSVSNRLNGSVDWSLGELFTIAELFDVPVTNLFPDQENNRTGCLSGIDDGESVLVPA